jgi:hypothetical protein
MIAVTVAPALAAGIARLPVPHATSSISMPDTGRRRDMN